MQRIALTVSGLIFFAVGLLHVWRCVMKIPVNFGETAISLDFSFVGAVVAFLLAFWMFTTAVKS